MWCFVSLFFFFFSLLSATPCGGVDGGSGSMPDGRFRKSLHSRALRAYMYRILYDTNDWDVDDVGSAEVALDKILELALKQGHQLF